MTFQTSKAKAFTLIEIAIVTVITGILAMAVAPSLLDQLEQARLDAEKASLAAISADLRRSFAESDWARNISAMPGEAPSASVLTVFGRHVEGANAADGDWFVKLGRLRGIVPILGSPVTEFDQKSLYDLAYNPSRQPRILVAGPNEVGQQRYLLISLAQNPAKGLTVPANDNSTAWFDGIWNNNWESKAADIPTDWLTRINTAEQDKWRHGRGATTLVNRLVVVRIVQPKFRVTLNNNHPTYNGWLDANGTMSLVSSLPGSGPTVSQELLSGRLVVFRRGILAPGSEAYRVYLNENSTFSVEP